MKREIHIVGLLIAVAVVLAVCVESRVGARSRSEAQVIKWLGQISYADLWDYHSSKPDPNWNEWYAVGHALPDGRTVLENFLKARDTRVELPLVARALGRLGNRQSVSVLVGCLNHWDWHLRLEACDALGALRFNDGAVEALGRVVGEDHDKNVRATAVSVLDRLGGDRALNYLELATHDEASFVADLAKDALARRQKQN